MTVSEWTREAMAAHLPRGRLARLGAPSPHRRRTVAITVRVEGV
jgi:hypothetical protein